MPRDVSILGLILLVSLGACEGGDLPGVDGCLTTEGSKGTMTATLDGEAFESCVTTGTKAPSGYVVQGLAYTGDLDTITLVVTIASDAIGEHALGDQENGASLTIGEDIYSTSQDDTADGTASTTSVDTEGAAGSFSFTATADDGEIIEVTAGEFEVEF